MYVHVEWRNLEVETQHISFPHPRATFLSCHREVTKCRVVGGMVCSNFELSLAVALCSPVPVVGMWDCRGVSMNVPLYGVGFMVFTRWGFRVSLGGEFGVYKNLDTPCHCHTSHEGRRCSRDGELHLATDIQDMATKLVEVCLPNNRLGKTSADLTRTENSRHYICRRKSTIIVNRVAGVSTQRLRFTPINNDLIT